MNIQLQYGTAVATVPAAALRVMDRATKSDLKVLLTLSAKPALLRANSYGECVGNVAAELGCTPAQVETALSFWRGAGVLNVLEDGKDTGTAEAAALPLPETEPYPARETDNRASAPAVTARAAAKPADPASEATEEAAAKSARKSKPAPRDELPRYTTEQLANLLEERADAAAFIDECQNIWGKMFNTHELNILLGLVDYLGLEWDYVITLLAFCASAQDRRGTKRSLHFVEKTAFSLYDEEIRDLPALQEKLRQMEQMEDVVSKLRRMFGMGERALTPTEKRYFSTWLYDYRYDMDVITRAYEVTVDAKGSPNIKYMDAVLANWNRDGLRTTEDVERSEAAFRESKRRAKGAPREGSFDTEDFFAAAVRRSLGEDFDPDKTGT